MFVDTNILVNARIIEAPDHDIARERLERAFEGPEPLRISRQVVREAWPITIRREEALDAANSLIDTFEVFEDGPAVTEILVALCREIPSGGRQIHDANIVATMLAYGERRLLTFNTADFRRYGDHIELVSN